MSAQLPKGSRITGDSRNDLASSLVQRYERGESIRSLADDIGRSYGFVHGVLAESGVAMRSRGGATRGAALRGKRARHRHAAAIRNRRASAEIGRRPVDLDLGRGA